MRNRQDVDPSIPRAQGRQGRKDAHPRNLLEVERAEEHNRPLAVARVEGHSRPLAVARVEGHSHPLAVEQDVALAVRSHLARRLAEVRMVRFDLVVPKDGAAGTVNRLKADQEPVVAETWTQPAWEVRLHQQMAMVSTPFFEVQLWELQQQV